MAYQCLAAGAKGLIFYSWFDLLKFPDTFDARYADITQLAADIHAIEPWILADAPTGLSLAPPAERQGHRQLTDRKSTRLNSSHSSVAR
ncbi:MAG TPA: hypothetical protein DCZ72_09425, partial [Armatimonadetes bacterium]|nr:hypothetical protein [Armatimonadota bacterium]